MDNKKYIWSRRYKDNNTHKNAQNNIHKISVIYKDFNLTTSDEILKMKNDLKDDKNYNVLFNYDSDNYIINITILE